MVAVADVSVSDPVVNSLGRDVTKLRDLTVTAKRFDQFSDRPYDLRCHACRIFRESEACQGIVIHIHAPFKKWYLTCAQPKNRRADIVADELGRTKADVAYRLELTRQAFGLSQKDFAEEAGLKLPRYNQYESGKYLPSVDAAHALRDRYNLTFDWIFCGDMSGIPYKTAAAIAAIRKLRDQS